MYLYFTQVLPTWKTGISNLICVTLLKIFYLDQERDVLFNLSENVFAWTYRPRASLKCKRVEPKKLHVILTLLRILIYSSWSAHSALEIEYKTKGYHQRNFQLEIQYPSPHYRTHQRYIKICFTYQHLCKLLNLLSLCILLTEKHRCGQLVCFQSPPFSCQMELFTTNIEKLS